jgi:hypothetical protein
MPQFAREIARERPTPPRPRRISILDARQSDFDHVLGPRLYPGRTRANTAADETGTIRKIEYWHMGSIQSFRILYQNAEGLGGEVKWDGENAEVTASR